MKIEEQFKALEGQNYSNWQRMTFVLRKHQDMWAHHCVKPYWGQMKISYMPIICNISSDGNTVMDIARKSVIAKQSISRTIKELEEHGMIVTKQNEQDKRSELLELSKKGKQFIVQALAAQQQLQETYKELVGEKELAIAVDVINKIIEYHESLDMGSAPGE